MIVFLDTNIILENVLGREDSVIAHELIESLKAQDARMYISEGSFYTMIYLVDKFLRKQRELSGNERISALRVIMSNILIDVEIVGRDKNELLLGVSNLNFKDMEDSCQYQAAKKAGCSVLITFNTSDFLTESDASLQVLTPQQYLIAFPS